MKVRFWGVRGSIPVSGDHYSAGGNTSCVEIEHDGHRLILDGGTGLRGLGEALGRSPIDTTILFSHYHWDHIQGVPFFSPAYNPKSCISFGGVRSVEGGGVREMLERQMQPPTFPIRLDALLGVGSFIDVTLGNSFAVGPFTVCAASQPHPNGAAAYRVEVAGKSVVYATDTEHGLAGHVDPSLIELARGVDLLIHDAQYLEQEYRGEGGPARRGWGHSTWNEAVEAAEAAGAKRLALYHHDPTRDDAGVAAIEAMARARFAAAFAAREGETLDL